MGSGKTLMELLELEMRARAIKSLLESKTNEEEIISKAIEKQENNVKSTSDKNEINLDDKKKNKETPIEEDESRKRQIQIAKEQLHISEAKKREEEELIERQQEEIRQRFEEQQRIQKEKEAEEEKKMAQEAERKIKALKKK